MSWGCFAGSSKRMQSGSRQRCLVQVVESVYNWMVSVAIFCETFLCCLPVYILHFVSYYLALYFLVMGLFFKVKTFFARCVSQKHIFVHDLFA